MNADARAKLVAVKATLDGAAGGSEPPPSSESSVTLRRALGGLYADRNPAAKGRGKEGAWNRLSHLVDVGRITEEEHRGLVAELRERQARDLAASVLAGGRFRSREAA